MPFLATWDNDDHTVIRITCTGRSDAPQPYPVQDQLNAMLDTVAHSVAVLVLHESENWVSENLGIQMQWLTESQLHPRIDQVVLVLRSDFYARLYRLFLSLNGSPTQRFVQVRSLKEAYDHLGAALSPAV
jgi:hypothetical protein